MKMNLQTYLEKKKLSVQAFAALIGVTPTTVYRYLSGDKTPVKWAMERIYKVTGGRVEPNSFYNLEK